MNRGWSCFGRGTPLPGGTFILAAKHRTMKVSPHSGVSEFRSCFVNLPYLIDRHVSKNLLPRPESSAKVVPVLPSSSFGYGQVVDWESFPLRLKGMKQNTFLEMEQVNTALGFGKLLLPSLSEQLRLRRGLNLWIVPS